jgi:hypothetical protein
VSRDLSHRLSRQQFRPRPPAGFGRFGNHLLVGNFSFKHSQINAFDPTNGGFRGSIPINVGANQPGGLWSI